MTVLALVFGAAILLTWMLVHSYSGREAPTRRRAQPEGGAGHGDAGHVDAGWMFGGSDASASDCSAGDGGGSCGDGGGGGGGD